MRMGVLGVVLLMVACGGSSRRLGTDRPASGGTGGDGVGGTGPGGGLGASGGKGSGAVGGSASGAVGGGGGKGAVGGSGGDGASGAGGEPDDIGGTGGVAGMVTAGGAGKPNVPITTCNEQFPFLGTWEGNVLDFYFEPMEALTLVLEDVGGTVTGTLTWGEGEPPPPVEGADIPYPPGYWAVSGQAGAGGGPGAAPWPGFPYTVVRGAGCDSVLRFGVSTSELWQQWCALQTPVFTPEYGWGCTLQGGGSSDGMSCTVQPPTVDWETYPQWKCDACGAFNLGRGVCACDESGCFANLEPTRVFELSLGDADGLAVLSGPDSSCGDCTVRLVRRD